MISFPFQIACEHHYFGDCVLCLKEELAESERKLEEANKTIRSINKQRNGLLAKARALDKINNPKK
jgi:hypothetical protein